MGERKQEQRRRFGRGPITTLSKHHSHSQHCQFHATSLNHQQPLLTQQKTPALNFSSLSSPDPPFPVLFSLQLHSLLQGGFLPIPLTLQCPGTKGTGLSCSLALSSHVRYHLIPRFYFLCLSTSQLHPLSPNLLVPTPNSTPPLVNSTGTFYG